MPDRFQEALHDHQAGRLDQAEQAYEHLLKASPGQPDVLHLLGVVAFQKGDFSRAIQLICQAIEANPAAAPYHCNLGEVHRAMGAGEQAESSYRRALALNENFPEAWNNLGLVRQAGGKLNQAMDCFRRAIALREGYAMAHNNLGNALRQSEQVDQAIAEFRKAVAAQPDLAEAHSNLGQVLLEINEPDEAAIHCRKAVDLRPDFAEARSNLGNVLRAQGRLAEAKACYAQALRQRPDTAMIYNNMAQALQEEGQLAEAVRWYDQALQREPHSARFHCNLASTLEEQGDADQAQARYRRALELDPAYAEAHVGMGQVLQDRGQWQEAMACFDEAIRLKPTLAPAHVSRGHLLTELGDFDQAVACFREALRLDRRSAAAYAELALTLGEKLSEEDAAAIQSLLAGGNVPIRRCEPMHSGLAAFFDSRGQFPLAAEHARKANELEKARRQVAGQGYDPDAHSRFVDRLIQTFSADYFAATRGWGDDSDRPVVIVGMPRSGTTLLEQILASHPRAFGAGELPEIRDLFEGLPRQLNLSAEPVDCVARLDRQAAGELGRRYVARLGELNGQALRVVDKMPDNYLYLGLIATLLPKARIIHCRRDVRDVAVSCWITSFKSIRWACDETWIARRIGDYLRLMDHWRAVLPTPMLDVDYEGVVSDIESASRRIVEWCRLDWDPACLEFHKTRRQVRTASLRQVRQPVYSRSVARWKRYQQELAGLFALCRQNPARGRPRSKGV